MYFLRTFLLALFNERDFAKTRFTPTGQLIKPL